MFKAQFNQEKVKQTWGWVEKNFAYKKSVY